MKASDFSRCGFSFCVPAFLLAACSGGYQSPLASPGSFQQSGVQSRLPQSLPDVIDASRAAQNLGVPDLHPDLRRSWMSPDAAKTKDLLYISNYGGGDVDVYSYPQGKQVGDLTGFFHPDGMCVDEKQDIWIVNSYPASIVEYAHGGKTPIATLADSSRFAVSCSIDRTTGDLAVSNFYGPKRTNNGNVAIYAKARGVPKIYRDSKINNVGFCGYDGKGDLFVDGQPNDSSQFQFRFAELPKGAKVMKNITLSGGTILLPGAIAWDGKYVTVGDEDYLYQDYSAVYQTTGAGGKIVGVTALADSDVVENYWIEGNTLIAPNNLRYSSGGDVYFYKYPAGNNPTKSLTKGFADPHGAAISE